MPGRPYAAVPNIFNTQPPPGASVTLLDQDFAQVLTDYNDSAIGYNNWAVDTGLANAYVLTLASAPSAYLTGMTISFRVLNANSTGSGGSTINVNSLGNVSLTDAAGNGLAPNILQVGIGYVAVFDGTQFRIINLTCLVTDGGTGSTLTQDCTGYQRIVLRTRSTTATFALTLQNLPLGASVLWYHDAAQAGGAQTVTCQAATKTTNNYTVQAMYTTTPIWTLSGAGLTTGVTSLLLNGGSLLHGSNNYLAFLVLGIV